MSTSTHTVNGWIKPVPFVGFLLVVGLLLGYAVITALPALPSDLAAPGVEAASLRGRAADADRYSAMARFYAGKEAANLERARAADAARWQGVAIAYNMQQTGLSLAQFADATRYTAMAGYFTAREAANVERGRAADATRWQGIANAYKMQQTGLSLAQFADAARYTAMAGYFTAREAANIERGRAADAARYTRMAQHFAAKDAINLQQGWVADAARNTAIAGYFTAREAANVERGRAADAARWQGIAIAYNLERTGLSLGQFADAARYTAMAQYFAAKEAADLQRGRSADAARYTAMAQYFAALGAART